MTTERHPSTLNMLRWFEYDHLPPELQMIGGACAELAYALTEALPDHPEFSAGLRHLLEAKDCFVRAQIAQLEADPQPESRIVVPKFGMPNGKAPQ